MTCVDHRYALAELSYVLVTSAGQGLLRMFCVREHVTSLNVGRKLVIRHTCYSTHLAGVGCV